MAWDGFEKRRFVRAQVPCKITMYTPTEHIVATQTEDIGAGGVRVILNEELSIRSTVSIKIFFDTGDIHSKGRVAWVHRRPPLAVSEPDSYDTGVEFYEIKEEDYTVISDFVERLIVQRHDA